MKTRLLWSLAVAAPVLLGACGGGASTEAPVQSFQVGGTLAGLGAGRTVVVADASGPSASLSANGSYSLALPAGAAYNLRVLAQPAGQTCTIANGSGTAVADVVGIAVTCNDNPASGAARAVRGMVAGMPRGTTLVLQLVSASGMQETTVNADGVFEFLVPVEGDYTVTVRTPPAGQACTVSSNGSLAAVPELSVSCASAASSFLLGGTLSGSAGIVSLRNASNGDLLTLSNNGAFQFAQPVLRGASYSVAIASQGATQNCNVANGAGVADGEVSNLTVACVQVVPPPDPGPAVAVPALPSGLTMTYSAKSFNLQWGTVTAPAGGGAVTYKLFEDPDGAGPLASSQIGSSLTSNSYTHVISALLHNRLNARYTLQACNTGGCSASTAAITPDLTKAIGYFKASNTGADDRFGGADDNRLGVNVALSSDGSTLAVGAHQEDSAATGINGNQADNSAMDAGAVYVFVRSAGVWTQQAYVKAHNAGTAAFGGGYGDQFGYSLALSGDGSILAVGARYEEGSGRGIDPADDNVNGKAGAVYTFTRSAGTWTQTAYIKASNSSANDFFGTSVALSSDGSTLAVGAVGEDSNATGIGGNQSNNSANNAGAVYVFTSSAGSWTQTAFIKASNTGAGDQFGGSVALSSTGDTLAVGASFEDSVASGINGDQASNVVTDSGAVYVFTRAGGIWSQEAYVKASNTGFNDQFGNALALSGDGNTLAVGAQQEQGNVTGVNNIDSDDGANNAGAVFLFTRSAGAWTQAAYVKPEQINAQDYFGSTVSLSADGNTLAVGAYQEQSNATGIGGSQTNNAASHSGSVTIFTKVAGTWAQRAYLKAGNSESNDRFGGAIGLSGDGSTLAVGAGLEGSNATGIGGDQTNNGTSSSGAVYIY